LSELLFFCVALIRIAAAALAVYRKNSGADGNRFHWQGMVHASASGTREPVRWQIEGDSVRWAAIDAMNDEELAKCFTTSAWSSWQLHALYPLQTKQRRAKGNREV
jgi:hypothetical protein